MLIRRIISYRTAVLYRSSEDSCSYRYQFDNQIELTATWVAADCGVEGQLSVTQVSGDEEGGLAKLQISAFLTAAGRCDVFFCLG